MDNFKIIYKILKALEKNLDYEDLEISTISAETLNITYERWEQLMIMLANEGLITGITITKAFEDTKSHIVLKDPPKMVPRSTNGALLYIPFGM